MQHVEFYGWSEVKRWWQMRFVRRTRPWNKWKRRCCVTAWSVCCLDAPVLLVSICPSRQIWMISNFSRIYPNAFVCCNFSNSIFCVWSFMIWKVILGYILLKSFYRSVCARVYAQELSMHCMSVTAEWILYLTLSTFAGETAQLRSLLNIANLSGVFVANWNLMHWLLIAGFEKRRNFLQQNACNAYLNAYRTPALPNFLMEGSRRFQDVGRFRKVMNGWRILWKQNPLSFFWCKEITRKSSEIRGIFGSAKLCFCGFRFWTCELGHVEFQTCFRSDKTSVFPHLDLETVLSCYISPDHPESLRFGAQCGGKLSYTEKNLYFYRIYGVHIFIVCIWGIYKVPWAPKTMKNRGFGHLKTRLFTIKTSKNLGFGGPWYIIYI